MHPYLYEALVLTDYPGGQFLRFLLGWPQDGSHPQTGTPLGLPPCQGCWSQQHGLRKHPLQPTAACLRCCPHRGSAQPQLHQASVGRARAECRGSTTCAHLLAHLTAPLSLAWGGPFWGAQQVPAGCAVNPIVGAHCRLRQSGESHSGARAHGSSGPESPFRTPRELPNILQGCSLIQSSAGGRRDSLLHLLLFCPVRHAPTCTETLALPPL